MFSISYSTELLFILFFNRYIFQYNNNTEFRTFFGKGLPSKNSIYVPKIGELVFGFFAFRIHPFLGDHLENGRRVRRRCRLYVSLVKYILNQLKENTYSPLFILFFYDLNIILYYVYIQVRT